jgi:hypothetical protein
MRALSLATNVEVALSSWCLIIRRPVSSTLMKEATQTKTLTERVAREDGAIGYIFLWILGVPASVLFVIFLMRGCT